MKQARIIAAVLIGALILAIAPKPMALADGAASTRNIIGGAAAAAAALIIINHNKKVHQKYAEDAQKQAALASQRDDARVAAQQYKTAYDHEVVVADSFKKEVALQKQQIAALSAQVASLNPPGSNFVAAKPAVAVTHSMAMNGAAPVQVSYGWGSF